MPGGIRPRRSTGRVIGGLPAAVGAGGIGGAVAGALALALALVAGCSAQRPAVTPIRVGNAFIMQASGVRTLAGYLVISNLGAPDRLLSVRSSAGGQVVLMSPATTGGAAARQVSELIIPAHRLTRLDPTGDHLELVGSSPVPVGNDVTLTLVFAHAGTMQVQAQVSNPQTDSGGYLGS